ncbi:MAG: Na+/H+ antiporter NhaA [Alphaproteobacteria bacterium]|nr:Na+/H+ antiporter NhaA [Alphaproteobacteria bacterium]
MRSGLLQRLFRHEAASGVVLMLASALALGLANSPLAEFYNLLLSVHGSVKINGFGIDKPILLWINDGLMAIFFLLVGLEIKREVLAGELSDRARAILPVVAAIGGMTVPALIYLAITRNEPTAITGWAIPCETDIAFSLGVMALFRSRVAPSLKVFLTALAIIDDLGAIIIIAIFYTEELSWLSLDVALGAIAVLAALNLAGVQRVIWYVLVGIVLWVFVLKSGVHATLAGVALALAIPLKTRSAEEAPLVRVEHELAPWVGFGILPLFGFANAGLPFAGLSFSSIVEPIPLGIAAGLFLGKQIGVFGAAALVIRRGWAQLPEGAGWLALYGTSILTGIGFTMSLFIGTLAFGESDREAPMRLGVLVGSALSALAGAVVLSLAARRPQAPCPRG